jgi:hypothetical protein
MALSNAERQARHRARIKARAAGGALLEHVEKAVDEAVDALWAFFNRPGPGGEVWADIAGCQTRAEYRVHLSRDPGGLVEACRGVQWLGEGLTAEEARAINRVVAVADLVELRR